jgi:hypothetical protein
MYVQTFQLPVELSWIPPSIFFERPVSPACCEALPDGTDQTDDSTRNPEAHNIGEDVGGMF